MSARDAASEGSTRDEPLSGTFGRTESSIVTLPTSQALVFPESCVSCLDIAHTARKHRGVRMGWWQAAAPIALPAGAHWVPYCSTCARRTRRRLMTLRLVGFPLFFVVMIASIALAKSLPGVGPLWLPIALGLTVALGFPIFLWGAAWRPPFDAIVRGKTIECRFRNADYAREFERLNTPDRDEHGGPSDPEEFAPEVPGGTSARGTRR